MKPVGSPLDEEHVVVADISTERDNHFGGARRLPLSDETYGFETATGIAGIPFIVRGKRVSMSRTSSAVMPSQGGLRAGSRARRASRNLSASSCRHPVPVSPQMRSAVS
jgi:hypothetical protein